MTEYRMALNEDDFRRLVAGDVVERRLDTGKVKIILSDIGYSRMLVAVLDATRIHKRAEP